ncbi:hypothetical protein [Rhizobium sp. MHM7A]|uniref:hypothetical protein n=1 Tax=Rhizobium sp. MHM7A TaxID=2583233 RepID=UPI001105EFF6|nr:hypothetical protein [Rhizobium sp. MHM7A]TLX16204.1 hypothetical protein FFR93_02435 [Rhizobium sp. MHM7A]
MSIAFSPAKWRYSDVEPVMPACESDFVTGRSILEGEPAVAIIVDVRDREHSAKAPINPHDRFMPLSYMINGTVDDGGFFVPKGKQLALDILLKVAKADTWADVRHMLNAGKPVALDEHPVLGKTVISPGIAIMHASTAFAVSQQAFEGHDVAQDVKMAAKILVDAHQRLREGDRDYFFIATGGEVNSPYETLAGETIDVPDVSNAFSRSFASPAYALKRAMGSYFKEIGSGNEKLAEPMYEMFARYQVFLSGLHALGKKLEPSAFANYDNTLEVTKFHLNEVVAAVSSIPSKPCFGPGYEDEFSEPLEAIATQLKEALTKVEENLSTLSASALRRGTTRYMVGGGPSLRWTGLFQR